MQKPTILITRPAHQAQNLCEAINTSGGQGILFPSLVIAKIQDDTALRNACNNLSQFDIAIFVSANAVTHAKPYITQPWPKHLSLYAIGPATHTMLQMLAPQQTITCPPSPFNSEALLALQELQQVDNKNIVIFCGQGGRQYLTNALCVRGATVTRAPSYQRLMPEPPSPAEFMHWQNQLDIIVSTSNEALQNLVDALSPLDEQWLQNMPFLVISNRMADKAKQLGLKKPPIVAENASDNAILTALLRWWAQKTEDRGQKTEV